MSNIDLNPDLYTAFLNVLITAIDAGSTPGYIEFFDGAKPTTPGAAHTSTQLGTCLLSQPCGTAAAGILTFDDIDDDLVADNSGTLAWGRIYDGDGNFVMDGACGLSGSTALFRFNQLGVVAGGALRVSTGVISFGG